MKIKFEPNEFEVGKEYHGKVVEIGGSVIPVDGTLLQVKGQPEVWYMMGGERRHIITMEVFNKMAEDLEFKWGDQNKNPITQEELEMIPLGEPIKNWPELEPLSPIRLMYGVINGGDLERVRNCGCNTVFCTNFDSKSLESQEGYINECKRLGLKVTWNLWGGNWEHRDETIMRWKDDSTILGWYFITEPYLEGSGCYLNAEEQRARYNHYKGLSNSGKPFIQDRGLWNPHPDYWAEDCLDILMVQSYPYEFPNQLDMYFERTFANLVSLKTKPFHIIPLIQCFWAGNYKKPPRGGIKYQFDRWEALLESKGWSGGHCAFYIWSGYNRRDVKNNLYLYDEIKELNKNL